MIDINTYPLITAAILSFGIIAIAGGLVYWRAGNNHSLAIGFGLISLAALVLIIGAPAAALVSGFSVGQILTAVFAGIFFFSLGLVALVALAIVLFVLGSVFVPVR